MAFKKHCALLMAGLMLAGCMTTESKVGSSTINMTRKEAQALTDAGVHDPRVKVENGEKYRKVSIVNSGFPYRAKMSVGRCSSEATVGPLLIKEGSLKALQGYLGRLGYDVVVGSDVPSTATFRMNISSPVNLCAFVEDVARQTGTKIFMPDNKTVVFTTYEYQVFNMPVLPGSQSIDLTVSESDSIGNTMEGAKGGAGGGVISASDKINRDLYQEIQNNLNQLLQGKGFFFFDRSIGAVHVFAPAEKIIPVRQYIESISEQLGKQIVVKLTILEVQGDTNREFGTNWYWALRQAVVNNPWRWGMTTGTMNFSMGAGESLRGNTSGTYNFGMTSVGSDPHQFVIKMLKEYASVKVIDQTEVSLVNGMGTFVSSGEYSEYIKKLERTSGNNSDNVSVSVDKGTAFSGLRLYVSGAAVNDVINMKLYLDMEELTNLQNVSLGKDLMVQNPTVVKRKNMTMVQARDGETVALVSMMRDKEKKSQSGPGIPVIDSVLGQTSTSKSAHYLVFLVTPRVVNPDAVKSM